MNLGCIRMCVEGTFLQRFWILYIVTLDTLLRIESV